MDIVFDSQPLIDSTKTGVGFCEYWIVRTLLKRYSDNNYFLEYFSFKNAEQKREALESFCKYGATTRDCNWFPGSAYRLLWNFIPIHYSLFFPTNREITHFFNYHIPPGVKGKKIATVYDMTYRVFPETVRLKTKIMLDISLVKSCQRSDKIMTTSKFSKQEIIKYMGIDEEKIFIAYCGVDTQMFYPISDKNLVSQTLNKYNIPKEYILYLGTLEPRKNIERLINAYSKIKMDIPDAPALVLAGRKGWLYDKIFKTVTDCGLEKDVIFTGYVDDKDVPYLYSGAKCFVFPSLYEGFGMPPLEAMACGTPVITSNASSLPEVVGDAALLVDPYDEGSIYINLKKLIEDENFCHELSKRGTERAKLFTWDRCVDIIMEEYEKLLRK